MQNYNQQQQAVILKGIAQQILSMNVPSFNQAEKLFKEFGIGIEKSFTHIVFCKGLYSIERNGNYNYIMLPFGEGISYLPCYSEEEAIKIAESDCNEWGKSLSGELAKVKKTTESQKLSMKDTFITGFDKNGRYWEVHKRPNWL